MAPISNLVRHSGKEHSSVISIVLCTPKLANLRVSHALILKIDLIEVRAPLSGVISSLPENYPCQALFAERMNLSHRIYKIMHRIIKVSLK